MRLDGKKALVTGGTRGLGRAIVLDLARSGAHVVTCGRREGEAARDLARELKETGGDHHVMAADVAVPDDVTRLVNECRDRFGSLDVVVHNAGVISHVPFGELTPSQWSEVLDVNLGAACFITQAALPLLTPKASVVYVGSRVATVGIPLRSHYTAAKAGLIGLARSLAKELGPRGVRVNVVAPGPIETEAEVPPEVRERYQRIIALGRLGRPEDVARAVTFLAGDDAAFITGETLHVDGGI
ncbi:SDR family NAD(P)-dependent oxidoreductase [Actinoallomurus iriomotensis]|uniref:Short-chain dehydrogenase n=1 Tax=Actinoallomurus iriomotensis TaxID=478107 RepID=A0A9W6RZK1_9ACTN|nr:3-oxoacyl-ACP reductase family protein [Actinoallomurus iriomotensis]GLY85125.1 short-chain dehydrogenase [Actinoallomurus iriomotensis]